MTFREKLARDHPEDVSDRFVGGCYGCPTHYGYEKTRSEGLCHGKSGNETICRKCWDREIPMTPEEQAAQEKHDLAINAEIIRGYCGKHPTCYGCPAEGTCEDMPGSWSAVFFTSAAKQRAMLDAFEGALPPLDEDDGGRPQAAPTEPEEDEEELSLDDL